MENPEGFTKKDLEYINTPFTREEWDYINTLDPKYFKK
jgi:sialic acid synthase SpsE